MRVKTPIRKKRITFLRSDSNKKTFNKKWRKPRGVHNKRRLHKQGHQKRPVIGFGNPKELRGLNKDNLLPITIKNVNDFKKIDKVKNAILVSKTVGIRKKLIIIEEAKKLGIKIYNIKDDFVKEIEEKQEEKKKETKKKEEQKKKSKKESLKKAEEKKKEEKKKEEKKEETPEETPEEKKEELKEEQKEKLDLIKKEEQVKQINQAPKKQTKDIGKIKEMIPEGNKS